MARIICNKCLRAESACICEFFSSVNNEPFVIVLQHPSEVKQAKGTVTLLANSLTNCRVFIGENFNEHAEFLDLVEHYGQHIALLYPSEDAVPLGVSCKDDTKAIQCIIVLDGTWKKAYKIYQLNPLLHTIRHITLPTDLPSRYRIRKTSKANGLSSFEACVHALSMLEPSGNSYQVLLEEFERFNEFQLTFLPKHE